MLIPAQNELFELEGVHFLTHATRSPIMKEAVEAGKIAVESLAKPWALPTAGKKADGQAEDLSIKEQVLRKVAILMNAEIGEIAQMPSTSFAMTTAAENFIKFGLINAKSEVAIFEDQFWSNVYPWQHAVSSTKAKLKVIKPDEGLNYSSAMLKYLSSTKAKEIVVAIPGVLWCNGAAIDLQAVSDKCKALRKAGKKVGLAIDVTQTLGVVPFDIKAIDADFVCASVYKWLCGPPAFCIMYAKRDPYQLKGIPLDFHLTNRAQFGGGVKNEMQLNIEFRHDNASPYPDELLESAERFNIGGLPNPIFLPMLNVSLKHILEWGVENIQETLWAKTKFIEDHLRKLDEDLGGVIVIPSARYANILSFKHKTDNKFSDKLSLFLKERNVIVASRFGFLRVSPYLYTTQEDLDAFCNGVSAFFKENY